MLIPSVPASILPASGSLGAASGNPVEAARAWLRDHADAFGMSVAAVDGLRLVSSQKLAQSDARAVLLRQDFGGVAPALGGLVTVGVADGAIAYVSSSLVREVAGLGGDVTAFLTPEVAEQVRRRAGERAGATGPAADRPGSDPSRPGSSSDGTGPRAVGWSDSPAS